ncbi:MAG: hypothetical protein HY042_02365 [Spirochaetia bacterium]|nr:hypothetical protein [Spirochaetia bacterium]
MGLLLKFAGVCGALALIISLGFGLAGGNRPVSVIVTAFVSTVIGALVGVGVYKLLEMRVPEILAAFSGGTGGSYDSAASRDLDRAEEAMGSMDGEGGQDRAPTSSYDVVEEATREAAYAGAVASASESRSGEPKSFGDHIIVNKVKIKNEPKLMAAAIRTMLARD